MNSRKDLFGKASPETRPETLVDIEGSHGRSWSGLVIMILFLGTCLAGLGFLMRDTAWLTSSARADAQAPFPEAWLRAIEARCTSAVEKAMRKQANARTGPKDQRPSPPGEPGSMLEKFGEPPNPSVQKDDKDKDKGSSMSREKGEALLKAIDELLTRLKGDVPQQGTGGTRKPDQQHEHESKDYQSLSDKVDTVVRAMGSLHNQVTSINESTRIDILSIRDALKFRDRPSRLLVVLPFEESRQDATRKIRQVMAKYLAESSWQSQFPESKVAIRLVADDDWYGELKGFDGSWGLGAEKVRTDETPTGHHVFNLQGSARSLVSSIAAGNTGQAEVERRCLLFLSEADVAPIEQGAGDPFQNVNVSVIRIRFKPEALPLELDLELPKPRSGERNGALSDAEKRARRDRELSQNQAMERVKAARLSEAQRTWGWDNFCRDHNGTAGKLLDLNDPNFERELRRLMERLIVPF